MRTITIILGVLLSLSVLVNGIQGMFNRSSLIRHEEDQRSLKRAYRTIEAVRDSLHTSQIMLTNRDKYWNDVHKQNLEQVVADMTKVNKKEIRYEKAFVTPPPAWDQHELDSLRRAVISRGYKQN